MFERGWRRPPLCHLQTLLFRPCIINVIGCCNLNECVGVCRPHQLAVQRELGLVGCAVLLALVVYVHLHDLAWPDSSFRKAGSRDGYT